MKQPVAITMKVGNVPSFQFAGEWDGIAGLTEQAQRAQQLRGRVRASSERMLKAALSAYVGMVGRQRACPVEERVRGPTGAGDRWDRVQLTRGEWVVFSAATLA